MEIKITENPLVKSWLAEKRSKSTRETYPYKLRIFLDYFGLTPDELLKLTPKQTRTLALRFQNEQPDMPNNTILSHLTAVSSFLDHHDKTIKWKRARVKPRPDVSSHIFSDNDLSRMFQVGDTRDKAMLSSASSLGWEISGFVRLKRKKLEKLIERAKENDEKFIYFRNIRQKTGAPRLGVLNPLAVKWLDKWFKTRKSQKKMGKRVNAVSDIFKLTDRGIQNRLKILAKRAEIKTTGDIRFHNIRKWVMSGLSRSGFNEFQIKYFLGKAIPMTDQVYLQTLEQEIRERYPEAYENHLDISTTIDKDLKKKTKFLKEENEKLKRRIESLESQKQERSQDIEELKKQMTTLRRQFESLIKS
jgi:integrase